MITCTEPLATDVAGILPEPGAPGWDAARRPFDLAVDQRPALVALPTDEHQVAAAVREAARRDLRVVAQRWRPRRRAARLARGRTLASARLSDRRSRSWRARWRADCERVTAQRRRRRDAI